MVLIGHRNRLFDTMAVPAPSTIDQIAAQTGLQDHYVREWLATTAAGRREPLESGIGGGFGAFDDHVCRLG
jgi:hypothetical protein